jgi:energy-coupling factor transporter transmembrane protein EcfT
VHVALNEYADVVLLSLRRVPLLRLQSKDILQVHSSVPLGCQYAVHVRSCDPFLKVMIEILQAFLREMGKSRERKDATKQDTRATWNRFQMCDVRWGQMSLEFCATKATIVRECAYLVMK